METFNNDVIWLILRLLNGNELMLSVAVCKRWCRIVANVSQMEWRTLYRERVCDSLTVREEFDWRRAAVIALTHDSGIEAWCVWNSLTVRVVSPWRDERLVFDNKENVLFHNTLRRGVKRNLSDAFTLDFVYNGRFRLRRKQRSCVSSHTQMTCFNCQTNRRPCLRPKYTYYIRSTNDEDPHLLDEHLSHLLTDRVVSNN